MLISDLETSIRLYKAKVEFYESQHADVTARELKYVVDLLERILISMEETDD